MMGVPEELYLDLLKKALTNGICSHAEYWPVPAENFPDAQDYRSLEDHGLRLVVCAPADPNCRAEGRDWSPFAHTMIGLKRPGVEERS